MELSAAYLELKNLLDRYKDADFFLKQMKTKKQKIEYENQIENIKHQTSNILHSCPELDKFIMPDNFNYAFFESDLEKLLQRIEMNK